MEFRRGLDERKKRYVVGFHSDRLVFLEFPVFEEPDSQGTKSSVYNFSVRISSCEVATCLRRPATHRTEKMMYVGTVGRDFHFFDSGLWHVSFLLSSPLESWYSPSKPYSELSKSCQ